jgi:hypothetical protein
MTVKHMTLKYKKALFSSIIILAILAMTGCGQTDATVSNGDPVKGPVAVTKQFYEYISEAKIKGGTILIGEAFKLIDSKSANLNLSKFGEIIKNYPPGFMVEVGKAEINNAQALVAISYKMPSSFGDYYTVNGVIPLNVDQTTNSWKIDFTGDSYGVSKDELLASTKSEPTQ